MRRILLRFRHQFMNTRRNLNAFNRRSDYCTIQVRFDSIYKHEIFFFFRINKLWGMELKLLNIKIDLDNLFVCATRNYLTIFD